MIRPRGIRWLTGLKNKNETNIFLQESHSTPETELLWKLDWGGDIVFNHGTFNSTGIALLFNQSIVGDIKIQNTVHNITPGRATLLDIEKDGTVVRWQAHLRDPQTQP